MKRPRGVTIIGCLLLAQGLLQGALIGVVVSAYVSTLVQRAPSWLIPVLANMSIGDWASISANAIIAILALVGGGALLLLRPWAWTVAMLLQGYSLTIDLWSIYLGYRPYLEMLLPIVIVFYLNTREVRRVFETLRHPTGARPLDALDSTDAYASTNTVGNGAITEQQPEEEPVDPRTA